MLIAHRIALDPNNVQATDLARAAGTARFAYDNSHLPQAENEPQDKSQVHGEFRHSQNQGENQGVVGVDLGVSALATLSTGEALNGPKPHKALLARL